jgi:hypothetical protein
MSRAASASGRFPPRADQDFHALPRERACRFETYPFASASDERRLAGKAEFHCPRSVQDIFHPRSQGCAPPNSKSNFHSKGRQSREIIDMS